MAGNLNRRRFLEAVGVTGGATALYGTMQALGLTPTAAATAATTSFRAPRASDFTLTGRAGAKVLILGAGIAGMTCAYELAKAGYDCQILEARTRPGGRNWTVRGGTTETDLNGATQTAGFSSGQYMNAGPARIAQHMVTMDYCRELGVALEPFINQNFDAYLYREGAEISPSGPTRLRTVQSDYYGYVSELLAKATNQGALDQELTKDDQDQVIAFLETFGDLQQPSTSGPLEYLGSTRRGYSVVPGAGSQQGTVLGDVPSVSSLFQEGLGVFIPLWFDFDQASPMFQPVGGMDRIAYALAARVGASRITYGAEVTQVTNLASGVRVAYTDASGTSRMAQADYCIATLPPQIMARVPHNLGADITTALQAPLAVPVGKLGLEYDRRWWEEDDKIYGGISGVDTPIMQIWYPSYGYQGDRGVILGYYQYGEPAYAYGQLTPAQRLSSALTEGAKVHGDTYGKGLTSSFSVSWEHTRYTEGGWVQWDSQPTNPSYASLNKPVGNVYFCGDWLSYYIAWQAGAFDSARQVVGQLHARVLAN